MISNFQRHVPTPKHSEGEKWSPAHVFERKKNYLPSIPIYVYRQMVEDLAATKAELKTIKSQNKKLAAQNQQLKREVAKIIASTQNLQELLQQEVKIQKHAAREAQHSKACTETFASAKGECVKKSNTPRINLRTLEQNSGRQNSSLQKHILELESNQPYSVETSDNSSGRINVFWLVIAIIVISLTFSVGSFFVAKSLLNNNNVSR